jgi:hypothetical protein
MAEGGLGRPVDEDLLPSSLQLRRASASAIAVLGLLALTVVLPAEEGIDLTGVGAVLGLTQIGQLKNPGVHVSTDMSETKSPADGDAAFDLRSDEITVVLAPKKGTEVKATMRAGDQLVYSWQSNGAPIFFDFHGEEEGKPSSEFTSFDQGTRVLAKGAFEAPFPGVHGWYWKNTSDQPASVTLTISGVYRDLKELK